MPMSVIRVSTKQPRETYLPFRTAPMPFHIVASSTPVSPVYFKGQLRYILKSTQEIIKA